MPLCQLRENLEAFWDNTFVLLGREETDCTCSPSSPNAPNKRLGAAPPSSLLLLAAHCSFPQSERKVSRALEDVGLSIGRHGLLVLSSALQAPQRRRMSFSAHCLNLCTSLFMRWMLHLCICPCRSPLLMPTSSHMLFRGPSQPAQHLAGQAQNLLRPKHKIHLSLVPALNFDKHLEKPMKK